MMSTESVYMTRDGGHKRIAWSIVADSDTIYGFGRDMTAETEAAAALAASEATLRQSQKMESIGQLTGGVAHDFNNLLQVIGSNLQLLTKDVTGNDRGTRRIDNALEAVTRGARLVSQLLAFGRRQPLSPKVVNLGRLVREMDDILRRTLGEAIEIETVVAGDLWQTMVDPGNVENALLNLAINARDAMEGRGNLTIEVGNAFLDDHFAQTAHDVTPGQYVMLSVTDTGSGIARELLEKVFEPFFTTKPEGKGTGLGLSMVYGFVKQSGGNVKIYSELGHGTTIRLYLPRSIASEDDILTRDSGPISGGTETILVAEDDARVRESVIDMLKELGYQVLQAPDAQSALAIIESGVAVDLLFTDVIMPGQLKSTELVRMATERLPGLKVLFTSGYSENSIVHAGRLDPGVELLSKPYTREALARKVRHLLSASARPQTPQQAPPAAAVPKLTVLLCEDDAFIRMDTGEMLQDLGCTVTETSTAKAALAALQENSFDILMTDVGLPDMPGNRLATEARAIDPGLQVIFATGHSTVEGFAEDDRTCVLSKPYDSTALDACLRAMRKTVANLP
ncbi:MAG: response regulator [Pseudorhodobacter sp.]|nr:response regulator [Pseudorhodobacter sp.]